MSRRRSASRSALGQELTNVSFALLPVRTVRVAGSAIDSMGRPLGGGVAMLTPADATAETPMMFGGGGNVRGMAHSRSPTWPPARTR